MVAAKPSPQKLAAIARRVRELAADYRPPDFAHVPGPDSALFLCAIDHGTDYEGSYLVERQGPYEGSALLWALGCAREAREPGKLSAAGLAEVKEDEVAEMFRIDGETVKGPGERARLWRDLAAGLTRHYDGAAEPLIAAVEGRLSGEGGLLDRLAGFEAYADPLRKKSFLFCKIAERRGWLEVADPENWRVCADSVLMRLALRAGLVEEGPVKKVRAATADVFGDVAARAEISPPVLDDLLWERGREDADLLGRSAGDLREPERRPGELFY